MGWVEGAPGRQTKSIRRTGATACVVRWLVTSTGNGLPVSQKTSSITIRNGSFCTPNSVAGLLAKP